ncbi:MAG: hypothetical protein AB7K09_06300 [Planctomycetota bacterium]
MSRGDAARLMLVGLLTLTALWASRVGGLAVERPLDDVQVMLQPAAGRDPQVLLLAVRADAAVVWDRVLATLDTLRSDPPDRVVLMPVPIPPTASQQKRLTELAAGWEGLWQPGLLLADGTLIGNWMPAQGDSAIDIADRQGFVGVSTGTDGAVRNVPMRVTAPDGRVLPHVSVKLLGTRTDLPDSFTLNPVPGCVGTLGPEDVAVVRGDIRPLIIEAVVPRLEPARYFLPGTNEVRSAGHITAIALFNAMRGNWRYAPPALPHLLVLIVLGAIAVPMIRRASLWRAVPLVLVGLPLAWLAIGWIGCNLLIWHMQLPLMPAAVLLVGLLVAEWHRRAVAIGAAARTVEEPVRVAWTRARLDAASSATSEPPATVTFGRIADMLTLVAPVPFRMDVLAYRPATERRSDLAGRFAVRWADGRVEARDCGEPDTNNDATIEEEPLGRLIAGEGLTLRGLFGAGVTTLLVPARTTRIDGTQLIGAVAISTRHQPDQLMVEFAHILPAVAAGVASCISTTVAQQALRRLESSQPLPLSDRIDLLAPLADSLQLSLMQDRELLDSLPIGVALLDISGQLLWANPAFALVDTRRGLPLSMQPPLPELLQLAGAIPRDRQLGDECIDLLEVASSGMRGRYPMEIDGRPMLLTVRALHSAVPAARSEAIHAGPAVARRPHLVAVLVETGAESRWAWTRATVGELLAPLRDQLSAGPSAALLARVDQLLGMAPPPPLPSSPTPATPVAGTASAPLMIPFDLLEVCTEAAESAGSSSVSVMPGAYPPTALGQRPAVRDVVTDLLRGVGQPATVQLRGTHGPDGRPLVLLALRPANGGSLSALRTELQLLVDDTRDRLAHLGGRVQLMESRAPASDAVTVQVSFPPF